MTKKELADIRKTGQQIKDALNQLFLVLLDLEDEIDGTREYPAFYIDYDTQDMFHAASIMQFVCSNYAIKHNILNEQNAKHKITQVRNVLMNAYGLDTVKEARRQSFITNTQAEA